MKKWIFILILGFSCTVSKAVTNADIILVDTHSISFLGTHHQMRPPPSSALIKLEHIYRTNKTTYTSASCKPPNIILHNLPLWCNEQHTARQYIIDTQQQAPKHHDGDYVYEITLPSKTKPKLDKISKKMTLQSQLNLPVSENAAIFIVIMALFIALAQVGFCWRQTKGTN